MLSGAGKHWFSWSFLTELEISQGFGHLPQHLDTRAALGELLTLRLPHSSNTPMLHGLSCKATLQKVTSIYGLLRAGVSQEPSYIMSP